MNAPTSSNSALPVSPPPYVTTDLLAASYLKLNGLDCEIVPLGERTVAFRFHNPPSSILSTINDFYSGSLPYNPLSFDRVRSDLRREMNGVLRSSR